MDRTEARLEECFSKVFPDLTSEQIRNAAAGRVAAWDSVATVTLLMLIQEEFGVVPDMDRFEEFTSYQSLLDYVREAAAEG